MNRNDIRRVLKEHRIRVIRATGVICECGLEFETEEWHRKHVENKLWVTLSEQRGVEYLRRLIEQMLVLHPWDKDMMTDGKVCCPCGHESDNPLAHNRHVCEEMADAIIDNEREWNLK